MSIEELRREYPDVAKEPLRNSSKRLHELVDWFRMVSSLPHLARYGSRPSKWTIVRRD